MDHNEDDIPLTITFVNGSTYKLAGREGDDEGYEFPESYCIPLLSLWALMDIKENQDD